MSNASLLDEGTTVAEAMAIVTNPEGEKEDLHHCQQPPPPNH
ncbi:hypothetical protein TIFTF001_020636 [Ficus carica]|uniref:Uncharacterized protein n=1 Tax=Ficus carica TaxID=3494 RepID=A0AA88AB47_FICCA|nr:hypothetical protein TIFTF001_020636 [Ficus carica]